MQTIEGEKRTLRTRLRAARKEYVLSGGVPPIEMPSFLQRRISQGTVVAAYLPHRFEADPMPIVERAIALGARIALPHIASRVSPMRFLAWAPGDPLETSVFGTEQPLETAAALAPDIILTPLVGYDAALHRMGQGGGHYDRAFAHYPDALRVGIAFSIQELPSVPMEPWDMPLHGVVTERGALFRPEAA